MGSAKAAFLNGPASAEQLSKRQHLQCPHHLIRRVRLIEKSAVLWKLCGFHQNMPGDDHQLHRRPAITHHFRKALRMALAMPAPQRETVAWCRWQLGETAFLTGDYAGAERHYRDALITFPNYFRALASLAKVRAARGDRA